MTDVSREIKVLTVDLRQVKGCGGGCLLAALGFVSGGLSVLIALRYWFG